MSADRLRQLKRYLWIAFGQTSTDSRQIAAHVHSRRQEIRHQDDPLRSEGEAADRAFIRVGLRQLQERRFDADILSTSSQLRDDVMQIIVRLGFPAAMRDQEKSGLHQRSEKKSGRAAVVVSGTNRSYQRQWR